MDKPCKHIINVRRKRCPDLADHHLKCFLESKLGTFEGGLHRMLTAVREDKAAAAKRSKLRDAHSVAVAANAIHPHQAIEAINNPRTDTGSTVASKAGTGRRRGKEPVPMADPLTDTWPDLASASAEPDTQRLDSATGPHLVDRSSAPAPPVSLPGNPAPSPESDPGLKEAVQRLATRIKLIAEEGVRAKHGALYKYLVEAETPVLPADRLIPSPPSNKSRPKHTESAPTLRGVVAGGGRLFRRAN
ncbi:hypothetical protein APUTEX25_005843 [Auxenochlorella protothecoides]|uniref:Uncharacterized protein n=1 Tax=Auxenochlorella protothecoides TaxID=3075 RepID=A0A3M7L2N2_AUXPR|nr:hypothetical protein APUTEX25_005843 [Auxenochlorella protothecoides]|eukprot:RMZ55802.1 hypothetical protein APUTEX25_005843 [Auxenochlorella protothecoides]